MPISRELEHSGQKNKFLKIFALSFLRSLAVEELHRDALRC